ncbi:hypothetical protein JTB14_017861 [Gonioctena quinquepunctata]|nr:hypothetical protein JTB14_017861 [Gonioctena quinquepunctata]
MFDNNQHEKEKLIKELPLHFHIKDLGETSQCLGIKIAHDKEKGQVTLSRRHYVIVLLNTFGMQHCDPVGTPLDTYVKFENNFQNIIENVLYQQALKHVLRYLRGTSNLGIVHTWSTGNELTGFADADWASDTPDRKSFTAFVLKFAIAAIS